MPFILVTGIPNSGKTTVCAKLKDYFIEKDIKVVVISESDVITNKKLNRNKVYTDSKIEKEIRGILKSEYLRTISHDIVVILDGLNYIKGFRYELYCASKTNKTTQCTVHCDPGIEKAWHLNEIKPIDEQYDKTVFDGLVQRYEAPDSRNRWDSPLFFIYHPDNIPLNDIRTALFDRPPPPPNQSTQCPPLAETNFLHELDKSTQQVVCSILNAKKMGLEGGVVIPGTDEQFILKPDRNVSLPELTRLKRQFITYTKAHSNLHRKNLITLFVQYLNTTGDF